MTKLDCIQELNKVIENSMKIKSTIAFSELMAPLTEEQREICRLGRLYNRCPSFFKRYQKYEELKALNRWFKCGSRIITDFEIKRIS